MDTERDELSDLASDIKVTAQDVAADAARIAEIEATKATLPVTDPVRGFVYDVETGAVREIF